MNSDEFSKTTGKSVYKIKKIGVIKNIQMASADYQHSFQSSILQARAVLAPASPLTPSSSLHIEGVIVGHPHVTSMTATAGVTPASLVNGVLSVTPAPSTYTLPAAEDILAAFVTAGTPLITGNSFEVSILNLSAANAATISAGGVGLTAGNSFEPIPARKSGKLIFVCTNATVDSEAFTVFLMVST